MLKRPEYYNYAFLIFLFSIVALLPHWAYHLPVSSSAEREVIAVADAMAAQGTWKLPSFAGKPGAILPYWLATAGHLLIPEALFGYRIFFILVGLCFLAWWYVFMRNFLGHQVAAYSLAIFLACFPLTFFLFQANPFSLGTFFLASAHFTFYAYLKNREGYHLWTFYGSLALAAITGGPLLLLLSCTILLVYLMFKIKLNDRMLSSVKAGRGMLAVVVVSLPCYFVALPAVDAPFLHKLFSSGIPEEALTGEAFYYPLLFLLALLLPFSGFLPKAFGIAWKLKVRKDLFMLSCLAMLSILLWFAFAEVSYLPQLLLATPYAAMMTGLLFSQQAGRSWSRMGVYFGSGILILVVLAIIAGLYWYLPIFGHYSWLGWGGAAVLCTGTVAYFVLWSKKKTDVGLLVLCFSLLLFSTCILEVFRYQPQLLAEMSRFW